MDREQLTKLCRRFVAGELESRRFLAECLAATTSQSDEVAIDLDRVDRCGFPEVVFGEGKSLDAIKAAVRALNDQNQPVLATRVSPEQAAAVKSEFVDVEYNQVAKTLRLGDQPTLMGRVAVITAGTSDRPIAEEARETLHWMGIRTHVITDVGVAGPHRLAARWIDLQALDAAVVIAGMEGALPSVVGGYVDCPVVAVPTSVGYGASFDGLAALLGMLNSCAANVTVVNIDAGFKAGYVAGLIAHQKHRAGTSDGDHH